MIILLDDGLWEDRRFQKLTRILGDDEEKAAGVIAKALRIAKRFWVPERDLISEEDWTRFGLCDSLIEVGLAERRKTGIYIKGSEKYFAEAMELIKIRRKAGAKGGKVSAQRPRDELGRLLPKQNEEGPAQSAMFEGESPVEPEAKQTPATALNRAIWDSYQSAYFQRYKTKPVRNATVNGQIAQLGKRLGNEAPEVVSFYLKHNKSFFVEKCHPIGLLLHDAEAMRTQWARGRPVMRSEANQVDQTQSNMNSWDYAAKHMASKGNGLNVDK
jgi:hypothetical protein